MAEECAIDSNSEVLDEIMKSKQFANGGTNIINENIRNNGEGIPGEHETEGTELGQRFSNPLPGSVRDFYSGTSVFMTGGTGFLGKAILEKLLRSCDGIKTIYILLRQKRGKDLQQRHKALLENEIFDRVREAWPERLSKIKVVSGDISQPELGLSLADCKLLMEEVNIVIHSAATVKFDEPLAVALTLNTLGTKRMVELCHRIKNLKSIVHVSTAYSNSDRHNEIQEKFYTVNYDPDFLLQCLTNLSHEVLGKITPQIMGNHANTYTLTKALGEQIILKYGEGLPICIFRPSIITAAFREPFPGWIDNFLGPTGIIVEANRGTARSALCREECIVDLVPVDLVANSCIAVAWHHTNYSTQEPTIYNCTSSSTNPITWAKLTEYGVHHARTSPTQHVLMYPNFVNTTSHAMHHFWELTTHFAPSIFFDTLLRFQGKKPIAMKISKKYKQAVKACHYFALHQFIFSNGNMGCLVNDLRTAEEYAEFFSDVNAIHWETYITIYCRGVRKYLLKDTPDTMPAAQKKIRKLYWIQIFMKFISGYLFVKMLFILRARLMGSARK